VAVPVVAVPVVAVPVVAVPVAPAVVSARAQAAAAQAQAQAAAAQAAAAQAAAAQAAAALAAAAQAAAALAQAQAQALATRNAAITSIKQYIANHDAQCNRVFTLVTSFYDMIYIGPARAEQAIVLRAIAGANLLATHVANVYPTINPSDNKVDLLKARSDSLVDMCNDLRQQMADRIKALEDRDEALRISTIEYKKHTAKGSRRTEKKNTAESAFL
jgi:pyruvate/2-oxoglutarate dehydrogenase complex dihydrolipoamide acyltransferase (E2) component